MRRRAMRQPGPRQHGPAPDAEGHRRFFRTACVNTQEEPTFCGDPPTGSPQGACAGVAGGDVDYTGGSWFHTINGQVFPSIDVGPNGDIWRILNSSGSRSYELSVGDDVSGAPVLMQVLAIDGVPIDSLAMNARGQSRHGAGSSAARSGRFPAPSPTTIPARAACAPRRCA